MTTPRAGRHDRDAIVSIALALLDADGLPDLTMRRLASRLGVQPSALYWHFDSKQDLLAAVSDRILQRLGEPREDEDLLGAARKVRDALLAYRDGAEVVLSSAALRPAPSRAHDVLRAALRAHGAERPDLAATAVLQFILGHTTLVQQRMHGESYGAASTTTEHTVVSSSDDVFAAGIELFRRGAARTPAQHGSAATRV